MATVCHWRAVTPCALTTWQFIFNGRPANSGKNLMPKISSLGIYVKKVFTQVFIYLIYQQGYYPFWFAFSQIIVTFHTDLRVKKTFK